MNSIDIGLNKVNQEILDSIKEIKELCKDFSYGELAHCIYYIHTIRILKFRESENSVKMNMDRYTDVLRYIISCIYKYSNISIISNSNYLINLNKVALITKIANHIHNLHEISSLFTISDEVELLGERNQRIKLDLSKIMDDPFKKKSFEYSARFESAHRQKNSKPLLHATLLDRFAYKYSQYDLISKEVFGLTIKEIKIKLNELLNIYTDNIKNNEKNMPVLENGNIDLESIETLRQVVKSFIIDEKTLFGIFGKNGMKFIRQFTFKKSNFKSHELKYDYILRKPFLKIKNDYIIVPELLLDSLSKNFHYTLLENKNYSEKHKKSMSYIFVNEILEIGQKYGFSHFDSELELYKGRNKLGDIDLILRHKEQNYDILIEAKNHTVPMSVYFSDYKQIGIRLKELQKNWEIKVDKRYKHLLENYGSYNIKKNFKYIIVSRYPEILSHHSDYLVLSIDEFDFYLQNNANYLNFYALYNDLYNQENLDYKDVETIMEETLGFKIV